MSFLRGLFGPPNVEELKAKGDVQGLTKALSYKNDAAIRQAAAKALGKIGSAQAIEPLIAVFKSRDVLRKDAAEALVKIGAPAVESLIATLRDEDELVLVREDAARVLGKIGDVRAVEPLIAVLKEDDKFVRQAASRTLQEIGMPAVEPLIAALEGREWQVQEGAAKALGKIGDARVVGPLIAVLEKVPAPFVRKAVAQALGHLGDEQAVEPLITVLQSADKDVRRAAAEALEKIGWQPDRSEKGAIYWIARRQWDRCAELGAPAVEPLIGALKDKSTRKTAAVAMEKIGAPAVEPLIDALKDADRAVREAAAGVLDKIGWQPDRSEKGAAYWVAKRQWDQCAEVGPPAVGPLIAVLKDRSVRQAASRALEKIGAPAVEPLIDALKDADRAVREAAAGVLDRIGWCASITIDETKFLLANNVEDLCQAIKGEGRGVLRLRTLDYGDAQIELMQMLDKQYGQKSPQYKQLFASLLLCADCLWEFPASYTLSLVGRDMKGVPNWALYEPQARVFAQTGVCPQCGGNESLLVYECFFPEQITQVDVEAIRKYWQERAHAWWQSHQRSDAICDYCNRTIARGQGYLSGSYLSCEDCVRESLMTEGLENLKENPICYGSALLRKARPFRK
jgi:HEAT repeat protein